MENLFYKYYGNINIFKLQFSDTCTFHISTF